MNCFWQIAIENDNQARKGGAVGAVWHSHWRQSGYVYSESHKARDGKVFVIRDNWALENGLMTLAGQKYTDEFTSPRQEDNCRCYYEYIYSLRDLPEDMLTAKGKRELERARNIISKL